MLMGLAIALRVARLQHAHHLPNAAKRALAAETLKVWAPLSFHAGLAAQVPGALPFSVYLVNPLGNCTGPLIIYLFFLACMTVRN